MRSASRRRLSSRLPSTPSSQCPPRVNAAIEAIAPNWPMRHSTSYGSAVRTRSPRSLAVTMSADFRPGMLNDFDAEVMATPCSRAASDAMRNGV